MVRVSEPVYFVEALWRLREGATFDDVREHLLAVQGALVEEAARLGQSGNRRGRAAGVNNRHTLWTTARDTLVELRTLGLIPRELAVPSSKDEIEAARGRRYALSEEGRALLPMVERRNEDFGIQDHILMLQFQAHEEIRKLWGYLTEKGRLALPTSDVRLVRGDVATWLRDVATYLESTEWDGVSLRSAAPSVLARLRSHIAKTPKPSAKLANQWLDEAVGTAALDALGLDLGYVTVESTASLLARYFVVGRTFHLASFRGQVIYPIAEISPGGDPPMVRPRFDERRESIHREVLSCLERLGPGQHPIWKVRAEVAYALRVSDSAVDRVLAELRHNRPVDGLRLAFLNDFVGALPPSARPLIVGQQAYYQIAVLLPRPEDESNVKSAAA